MGEPNWHPGLEHSPVRRRLSAELEHASVEPLHQHRGAANGDDDEEPADSICGHAGTITGTQDATADHSLALDAATSANATAWRPEGASGPAAGEEMHVTSETITTATFTMPRLDSHLGRRRLFESSREGEAAEAEVHSLGHASTEAVWSDQHFHAHHLQWPTDPGLAGEAVSTPHTHRRAYPASASAAKAYRPHTSGSTCGSPMTSPAACFTPQSPPEASVDTLAAHSAAAAGATWRHGSDCAEA
jgi:hypothetical protein